MFLVLKNGILKIFTHKVYNKYLISLRCFILDNKYNTGAGGTERRSVQNNGNLLKKSLKYFTFLLSELVFKLKAF